MTPPDENAAHGGAPESPAAQDLTALRHALLRVHKALLEMERRDYERQHGRVNTGELFRLVLDHPQFAWLHSISEFVVRIDELLDAEEPLTPASARGIYTVAGKMFLPLESGDALQKKYFDALQRDPAVVLEHRGLARLFAKAAEEAGPA
ncbi:MAG: hypothetical protein LAN84_04955 [Acidobacteriia bacterium]|nr:hypothetical protein [Terriglobia bacterium]